MIDAASPTHSPILRRLRDATRPEHDAIESTLGLMGESLTADAYLHTLQRFYGYYRPVEEAIRAVGGWSGRGLDLGERQKTPLLDSDLRALGVDAPEWLPLCHQLPRIDSIASAFGGLYVMEGATLGGRFISRHIGETLGVTPETGGGFFHGYGERTGAMWQSFRTELATFATTQDTQDQVADAAVRTFRTLRAWFERGNSA